MVSVRTPPIETHDYGVVNDICCVHDDIKRNSVHNETALLKTAKTIASK